MESLIAPCSLGRGPLRVQHRWSGRHVGAELGRDHCADSSARRAVDRCVIQCTSRARKLINTGLQLITDISWRGRRSTRSSASTPAASSQLRIPTRVLSAGTSWMPCSVEGYGLMMMIRLNHRFTGPGVVYIQSRNPETLGEWIREQVPSVNNNN